MKRQKILQVLIAAIFVLGTFGFSAPQQTAIAKAQPQLQDLAAQNPGQLVRVIAQKMAGAQGTEALVTRLDGRVVSDLSIINAFAAEMTAEAALELARAESVKWVSLDAEMVESGNGGCSECIDTSALLGAYTRAVGADRLWNEAPYLQGQGITVAVVDSGIALHNDLQTSLNGKGAWRIFCRCQVQQLHEQRS